MEHRPHVGNGGGEAEGARPRMQQQQLLPPPPQAPDPGSQATLHNVEPARLDDIKNATCLYDVLRVSKGVSQEDLRRSYRKLALIVHPDKNLYPGWDSELFAKVNNAYSILSNPMKRKVYDSLGGDAVDILPLMPFKCLLEFSLGLYYSVVFLLPLGLLTLQLILFCVKDDRAIPENWFSLLSPAFVLLILYSILMFSLKNDDSSMRKKRKVLFIANHAIIYSFLLASLVCLCFYLNNSYTFLGVPAFLLVIALDLCNFLIGLRSLPPGEQILTWNFKCRLFFFIMRVLILSCFLLHGFLGPETFPLYIPIILMMLVTIFLIFADFPYQSLLLRFFLFYFSFQESLLLWYFCYFSLPKIDFTVKPNSNLISGSTGNNIDTANGPDAVKKSPRLALILIPFFILFSIVYILVFFLTISLFIKRKNNSDESAVSNEKDSPKNSENLENASVTDSRDGNLSLNNLSGPGNASDTKAVENINSMEPSTDTEGLDLETTQSNLDLQLNASFPSLKNDQGEILSTLPFTKSKPASRANSSIRGATTRLANSHSCNRLRQKRITTNEVSKDRSSGSSKSGPFSERRCRNEGSKRFGLRGRKNSTSSEIVNSDGSRNGRGRREESEKIRRSFISTLFRRNTSKNSSTGVYKNDVDDSAEDNTHGNVNNLIQNSSSQNVNTNMSTCSLPILKESASDDENTEDRQVDARKRISTVSKRSSAIGFENPRNSQTGATLAAKAAGDPKQAENEVAFGEIKENKVKRKVAFVADDSNNSTDNYDTNCEESSQSSSAGKPNLNGNHDESRQLDSSKSNDSVARSSRNVRDSTTSFTAASTS